jgi:hypothetical protein
VPDCRVRRRDGRLCSISSLMGSEASSARPSELSVGWASQACARELFARSMTWALQRQARMEARPRLPKRHALPRISGATHLGRACLAPLLLAHPHPPPPRASKTLQRPWHRAPSTAHCASPSSAAALAAWRAPSAWRAPACMCASSSRRRRSKRVRRLTHGPVRRG